MSTLRFQLAAQIYQTVDNLVENAVLVETRPQDFTRPDLDKYLDCIVFELAHTGVFTDAEVYVAHDDRLDMIDPEDIQWESVGKLVQPSSPIFTRLTAKYFAFRLVDRYPTERWKFHGLQVFGELIGARRR